MAKTHKAFAFACFFLGTLLQPAQAQIGQYQPSGCPGTWSNGMCICPDGRPANGVMGSTAIVCDGGQQSYQPQPEVQYCSNGGTCALDQTCCGNMCCGAGGQCSSAGCIPSDADDCGGGQFCKNGTICWRAPEDIADYSDVKPGELRCMPPEARDQIQEMLAQQRSQRQETKNREAEEKKRQEETKKETARKAQEEKKRAIVQQKTSAQSTSLSDEQIKANLEASKRRIQELTRQAQSQQSVVAPPPANWAQQQLEAWARGEGDIPKPAGTNAQQSATQGPPTQAKAPSSALPSTPGLSNAFVLSPSLSEQRTITGAIPPPASLSTFMCGSPPNQYPCPVTFDAPKATAAPPSTLDDDPNAFVRSGGSNNGPPSVELTPRQQEDARKAREKAEAELTKAVEKGLDDAPKLDCPFWKNITRCQTPSGFPGKTCRWCTNGDCDDNWFCQ